VFDGAYQDFLDTVGWESDEGSSDASSRSRASSGGAGPDASPPGAGQARPGPVSAPPAPDRKASAARSEADRRAAKQARAKRVQERARLIGPIEKRVAELESLIVSLERERDVAFAALAEASANRDAATIAKLSKKSNEIGPRIEWAYTELEKATDELERESRRFDAAG
jgi:ATP-binding cassette subfamily F protein 3